MRAGTDAFFPQEKRFQRQPAFRRSGHEMPGKAFAAAAAPGTAQQDKPPFQHKSPQKAFCRRSSPMVVAPPCPG